MISVDGNKIKIAFKFNNKDTNIHNLIIIGGECKESLNKVVEIVGQITDLKENN